MTATLTRTVTRPTSAAASTAVEDSELVARVGRGDREALGELYRRYRGKVAGYVARRIAREADTDDVVHETFLRAVREAGRYEPEQGRAVRSWLCGLAAWQLQDYARKDRWPYLAAVEASKDALRRPMTQGSEERETQPLSGPVRAAVARLTRAEQRAVRLRYLDGLSSQQAAEHAGSSRSAIETHAMTARRKLAWMLADHAPAATSPVQEMRPGQAIETALGAVGYDHPAAAQQWLRDRGVRVSKSHVYNIRNRGPRTAADDEQRPVRHGLAVGTQPVQSGPARQDNQVEHATDEDGLRALPERRRPGVAPVLRDRARHATEQYRDQHGRLPTAAELAEAAQVSPRTAAKVLHEVTGPRPPGTAPVLRDRALAASRRYRDQHGRLPTATELADTAQVGQTTARTALRELQAERPAQPDSAGISRAVEPAEQARSPVTDRAEQRHRVSLGSVGSQAVHSTPATRDQTATRQPSASQDRVAGREENSAAFEDASDGTGPPPAEASIARARIALAVLNAHRAEQDTRRATEQSRTEQLNQWHDQHDHANSARAGTGTSRPHDRTRYGEAHAR